MCGFAQISAVILPLSTLYPHEQPGLCCDLRRRAVMRYLEGYLKCCRTYPKLGDSLCVTSHKSHSHREFAFALIHACARARARLVCRKRRPDEWAAPFRIIVFSSFRELCAEEIIGQQRRLLSDGIWRCVYHRASEGGCTRVRVHSIVSFFRCVCQC